jgi:tRNA threonylcarbamoyl adenosine modification protein YeaZ
LRPSELEAASVSLGPGSWTGLRIGLSAAKAFAWAARIAALGVPSFEALAQEAQLRVPGHAVLTLRDARVSGCFCSLFAPFADSSEKSTSVETSAGAQRWIPECVLAHEALIFEVAAVATSHPGIPIAICGDEACLNALEPEAAARGWNLLRGCEHISAASLAECAWRRLGRGEGARTAAEIHKLAPLYLRPSSPEVKLQEAKRARETGATTTGV